MDNNQFDWVQFYKELAEKLLAYKSNRVDLVNKVKQIYKITGLNFPTLEKDNNLIDIDPFTVFGLFNKASMTKSNRIKIIKAIAELLGIEAAIPTSFDSIPVLNNQNATFYYFVGDRDENDINDLWALFESALAFSNNPTPDNKAVLERCFDIAINKKGNGNSKITMALYWIAPDSFLNLDQRNTWYIYNSGKMPTELVDTLPEIESKIPSEKYFEIVEKLRDYLKTPSSAFKDFKELSFEAWRYSSEINEQKKAQSLHESKDTISNAAHIRWTRPIIQALRDLGGKGTPEDVRKKIIENEKLSDDEISQTRGKTNVNKFKNEVAFARNDLVNGGLLDNSIRGIWSLTDLGFSVDLTDQLASDLFKRNIAGNAASKSTNSLSDDNTGIRYWIYAPGDNATRWEEFYSKGIMAIGWDDIGDLSLFSSKAEMKTKMKEVYDPTKSYMNAALATWQFANDIKPGDIVFAKKGMHLIVGRGIVRSEYYYDESIKDYANVRKVEWTHKGEWEHPGQAVLKTLTDITPYTEYVEKLNKLFEAETDEEPEEQEIIYSAYDADQFISEVYMSTDDYSILVDLLHAKKNVILQGAPGVGKTYAAKRLAYSMIGAKNKERVMMVQFHQSYTYEDFIMGFRPTEKSFELKRGAFYNFCKKAEKDSDNDYFFIIDEINRGNLSKIFGELFMLIETDKRGIELQLLYSDEQFSVPKNVYIVGLMNTADRSLAMLDYALRRRFAFFEMKPGFDTEGFKKYQNGLENEKFDKLIDCVKSLNTVIENDESLGEGFYIGHSYFCGLETVDDKTLSRIVEFELVPLLKEYWFDEQKKAKTWIDDLRSAIK